MAAEIRVALARAGRNQSDLADAIGMSRASFSERMNLRRAFTTDHLLDIADELSVDFYSLLARPVVVTAQASA